MQSKRIGGSCTGLGTGGDRNIDADANWDITMRL